MLRGGEQLRVSLPEEDRLSGKAFLDIDRHTFIDSHKKHRFPEYEYYSISTDYTNSLGIKLDYN